MAGKLAKQKAAGAFDTVVDFLGSFEGLEDPRQRAKVLYPLDEVLLVVISGCESWVEIARYGEKKRALLRRFRPFKDGTPSHDQLGDIFAVPGAVQFQTCFGAWVAGLTGSGPETIGIDGKTLRRACQEGGAKAPIHMVSAWSSGQNMVLGQVKVADKSNEITAIPKLLDMLTIKGAVVTIDTPRGLAAHESSVLARRARRGVPARNRGEDHRQGGRRRAVAEGQPGTVMQDARLRHDAR